MAKKALPAFMKKGMREGSKAEEAMDKKMGVKEMKKGKMAPPFGKKGMPAFKKGGKVGC
jgi:hypothetical protein